jgi:hypothetical protein
MAGSCRPELNGAVTPIHDHGGARSVPLPSLISNKPQIPSRPLRSAVTISAPLAPGCGLRHLTLAAAIADADNAAFGSSGGASIRRYFPDPGRWRLDNTIRAGQ